ncbi:Uncharacterised protein [Klebsiella michiganensis]|uniref:Uncharacterized protein n=1 Tax=Klebsiella michiganensis TaxID=1134687 RepID=A0A7H4N5A2_9ENTR|nr:Uncharacterised protein [Klebsiella michiganensis]
MIKLTSIIKALFTLLIMAPVCNAYPKSKLKEWYNARNIQTSTAFLTFSGLDE